MNSVQIHLALTHVPVILSLTGLVMLLLSLYLKNTILIRVSYIFILVAGLMVLPVYFTGEGAEESVEKLPGVSEAVIEKHEEVAKLALAAIAIAGVLALAALFSSRWMMATQVLRVAVVLGAIISGGLMLQTAHLGGQIRHSEIRNGIVQQDSNDAGEQNEEKDND